MSADHLFPATRFIELRKDIRHATPQGALASFRLCTPAQTHRSILEGDAALLDLSLSGCKIQTDLPLTTAHNYEMILYLPTFPRPILIAKAGIRWVADQRFGVKFLELHEDHDTFLHDAPWTHSTSLTAPRYPRNHWGGRGDAVAPIAPAPVTDRRYVSHSN